MTNVLASESLRMSPARAPEPRPAKPLALTLGEVLVLAALGFTAVGTWVSLGLAHAGAHSLGRVILTTGAAASVMGLVMWRRHPPMRIDGRELAVLGLVGAVFVVLAWPGFPYGIADKDPGVYVAHGEAIARTGSYELDDPVLDPELPPAEFSPGARFPGIWVADAVTQRIVPQFFHLYPAALATAFDAFGLTGLVNLNIGFGLLAVLALTLAVRRAVSPLAGTLAGLLLATNFLEIWHARWPGTEILTQMLYAGAILGVVVALDTRWRGAAGIAGVLTGLTFLARPDGLLIVAPVMGIGAALLAFRRWGARTSWFAAGLALTLPHVAWQNFVTARPYAMSVGVLSERESVAFVGLLAVGALVWRRWIHAPVAERLSRFDWSVQRRRAGIALTVLMFLLIGLAFARPWFFGEDYTFYVNRVIRSYDEDNLWRLSWFFTVPGILLVGLGFGLVAVRRWRARVWALLLPGLLVLPFYVYEARVAPRLMWSTRRYVPVAIVVIVVLIAIALARLLQHEGRWRDQVRGAGLLAAAGLLVVFWQQSWDLRDHHEFTGSFQMVEEIASVSGEQAAVFLWEKPSGDVNVFHPSRVLGAPLWFRFGQVSALLPETPTDADVDAYATKFGTRVFIVTEGPQPIRSLDPFSLRKVIELDRAIPYWEETQEERPDDPTSFEMRATVWEWVAP